MPTQPFAGVLVPVAAWDLPDDGGWPERVRATVMFAMSAMTDLGEHVDLGECDAVDLDAAAGAAVSRRDRRWQGAAAGEALGRTAGGRAEGRSGRQRGHQPERAGRGPVSTR